MVDMINCQIIQEIGIDVAVVLISTAILHIQAVWEKVRLCCIEWRRHNEVLKLLHKPIGYTPWTAARKEKEAMTEIRKKIQAQKFPWQRTPEERKVN